jgi:phosphate-selective porin OprO/OprP
MKRLRTLAMGLLGIVLAGGPAGSIRPAVAQQTQPAAQTQADEGNREDLEQRVKILERLREIEAEKAAEKAKETVTVSAGKEGYLLQSANGDFILRLRGILQFDSAFFQGDEAGTATDIFQITTARPVVEATVYKIYDFKIVPDFGQGKTVLQDAHMDARFHPAAKVRAGKFKAPFGLERLQAETDVMFVARALPTNLVPNRDIGIMVYGDALDGVFAYAGGVFNGVPDGASADADINDGKEEAARVFVHPFRKTSLSGLQGLGIGLGMTHGINRGKPTATGLPSYKSAGQQIFFSYLAGTTPTASNTVVADGCRYRLSPQLYYYVGRFGLMGELVRASQDVQIEDTPGTIQEETIRNESWQVSASFFLTRDKASYKPSAPRKNFLPFEGTPGGIEIAARYGRLSVDRDAFPIYADPGKSAREATEKAAGVSWYLNRNLRVMLDYSRTSFEGGAASGGNRPDEKVLLSRFQFAF